MGPTISRPIWSDSLDGLEASATPAVGEVDVLVVGGGVVGLTCARELARAGADVVLLEAQSHVGTGVTGQSTAKVTVGHGTTLSEIRRRRGDERAREYLDAAQTGLDEVRAACAGASWAMEAEHDLVCSEPSVQPRLEQYADDVTTLGGSVSTVPAPLPRDAAEVAVRHEAQLLIDPVRYAQLVADKVRAAGGRIVLGSIVEDVDAGRPLSVLLADGRRIRAHDVVLATHVPSALGTLAFAAVEQQRHYAVAGTVPELPGTTYDIAAGWSTRPVHGRDLPTALAVGGGHATGTASPTARLHALRVWAERELRMQVTHSWSTQDAFSTDLLPLVGRSPLGPHGVWFATGFGAWGLTLGTAAGLDLAGQLGGADARWPGWSPRRLSLLTSPGTSLQVGARTAGNLALRPFAGTSGSVAPGQGEVRRIGGSHVAISRDADATEHRVSARCTHLGCLVSWNSEATSWDCACHGSRFAPDGRVLHGPATRPLERRDAEPG